MVRFWIEKLKFMCIFAACGCWLLVLEEWKMTRKELEEAEADYEEINRKASERLLEAIHKE